MHNQNEKLNVRSRYFPFCIFNFTLLAFLILHFTFYISAARAAEAPLPLLNAYCFQKTECEAEPYKGTADESQAVECKAQDKRWVAAGFIYNCYAKPPDVPLQVSLGTGVTKISGIGNYIRALYTYLIGITGIAAGIMIVWAGITWLTSGGNPEHITEAKKKIENALIGLVLMLGSYLILQTVNPALVALRLPAIKMTRQQLSDSGSCITRPEIPCGGDSAHLDGKYRCDTPIYNPNDTAHTPILPCASGGTGDCTAQFCAGDAGGCYSLIKDRIRSDARFVLEALANPGEAYDRSAASVQAEEFLTKADSNRRACVNPSVCGGCADSVPWDVCISSACNCTLGVRGTNVGTSSAGQVVCMPPATASGEAQIFSGSGTGCTADIQCQIVPPRTTGVCNTGPAPDVCGPSTDESLCNRDIECVSNICNTEENPVLQVGFAAGRCRSTGWGAPGDECDRNSICQSGHCGGDRECSNMDGSEYD